VEELVEEAAKRAAAWRAKAGMLQRRKRKSFVMIYCGRVG